MRAGSPGAPSPSCVVSELARTLKTAVLQGEAPAALAPLVQEVRHCALRGLDALRATQAQTPD